MPIITFDDNDNIYEVTATDAYVLDFLGGNDELIVTGVGAYIDADMGDGIDTLNVDAPDSEIYAFMGNGDDEVHITEAGSGEIYGGSGFDLFEIQASNIHAHGGEDADVFVVSGAYNSLFGESGNDVFNCLNATAVFAGGGIGNDEFHFFGSSTGLANGGAGDDIFDYEGMFGSGLLWQGGAGDDIYYIGQDGPTAAENFDEGIDEVVLTDAVTFTLDNNIENLSTQIDPLNIDSYSVYALGSINNHIAVDGTNDVSIWSGSGNDTVSGGSGNDQLSGEAGQDNLSGGLGNDVLIGGLGQDVMFGGTGQDTFRFDGVKDSPWNILSANDLIQDFQANLDIIDLHNIDANANLAGNQAFSLVSNPTAAAGQLWIVSLGGGNFKVYGDVNGGGADFALTVHMDSANPSGMMFVY